METNSESRALAQAVTQLSAIAHEGRLILLRLLIQAGPDGLSATRLANMADTKLPTASARLLVLTNARLATSTRSGRHIIYRAEFNSMADLLKYLTLNCCCGHQDICQPLVPELQSVMHRGCNPPQ